MEAILVVVFVVPVGVAMVAAYIKVKRNRKSQLERL